ncbi:SLBB domain-containing protein [Imperialibacter roseus]|uniref:SLBB domain-containing protein n=1 Tax=Imperialibacter roseus TaxID=1324217 RepID=A0ABZ0IMP1_9BACT|nr:SLBB domain-containing protein [Imperialibacter roseus]WOK06303.1 SLBB domain-containing protein [Imperialibacter roseus]
MVLTESRKKPSKSLGIRVLFISTIVFLICNIAIIRTCESQSLNDLGTVKVDQLTDRQLENLLDKAESLGISNDQLYALAGQRGMPPSELSRLRRRLDPLSLRRQRRQERTRSAQDELRSALQYGGEDLFESIAARDSLGYDLTILEKKIFGYSIFHQKALNFSPNLNMPTPKNYTLGPGDEVAISIFGGTNDNFKEVITPDGFIQLKLVGLVSLSGLTIEKAENFLKSRLGDYYGGLKGDRPNTFLSLTVANIRSIKVNMVGELKNPGTYTMPSFAKVFNALYAAGGPTPNGTLRHIQVYRANKLVTEVDVYQFITKGQSESNITLEDNDVILLRPVTRRVEVSGAVRIEGLFEVKPDESFSDLLHFAGGFNQKAFKDNVTVSRYGETQKRVETISKEAYDTFKPADGDVVYVGEIEDRFINRVQVSGAVLRPGHYELKEGMTVRSLVEIAGGLRGDAFVKRSTLYRTALNFTLQAKSIDLGSIMKGDSEDILLQNEDLINIPSLYDLREEYYVQISGEVNKSGPYPYADDMSVGDLIIAAGGFKESATASSIEIARRTNNEVGGNIAEIITVQLNRDLSFNGDEEATRLRPFDHVFIRRSPSYQEQKMVTIEGEVFYPGDFALESVTMRISDLVRRAGGPNQFAYPKGATLLRRTEFYEEELEKDQINQLGELQRNTVREGVDNPESERLLLQRVNTRIREGKENLLEQELEKDDQTLAEEARKERLLLRGDLKQKELKETELVGINLDMILENPGSKYDLILQEGDIVTVPKELQTIRLRGEVLYPTTTRYEKGRGLKSYIGKAGGFTQLSSRKSTYVVYANGDVKRTRRFIGVKFYPGLEPGAEIIVPEAAARRKLSAGEVISLSTSFLILYSLLNSTFPELFN